MAEQNAPTSFIQLIPHFDVLDWDVAKEWMTKCKEDMKTIEPGCLFYDFTVTEDNSKVVCREGYVDSDDLALHLKNVGPSLNEQLSVKKSLNLTSLEVHCPADQLAACKTACKGLPCSFFVSKGNDCGNVRQSGLITKRANNTDSDGVSFVTLVPMFEVLNDEGAEKFMQECLAHMGQKEKGCMFYDFTEEDGDGKRMMCREAYVDDAALKEHIGNVGAPLGAALNDTKCLKMLSLEVHCPAAMLAGCKAVCDPFKPTYYVSFGTPAGDVGSLAQRGDFKYRA